VSVEQARACVEKMKFDAAFRARVMAVEGMSARMEIIKAEGFACGAVEISEVSGALTDAELGEVTGGIAIGGYRGANPAAVLFCSS
jgi:predicted ribosomally synthesized peptide with nif11-like leader